MNMIIRGKKYCVWLLWSPLCHITVNQIHWQQQWARCPGLCSGVVLNTVWHLEAGSLITWSRNNRRTLYHMIHSDTSLWCFQGFSDHDADRNCSMQHPVTTLYPHLMMLLRSCLGLSTHHHILPEWLTQEVLEGIQKSTTWVIKYDLY